MPGAGATSQEVTTTASVFKRPVPLAPAPNALTVPDLTESVVRRDHLHRQWSQTRRSVCVFRRLWHRQMRYAPEMVWLSTALTSSAVAVAQFLGGINGALGRPSNL